MKHSHNGWDNEWEQANKRLKRSNAFDKIARICVLAAGLSIAYIFHELNKPNDGKLIKKPLTVTQVGYEAPAGTYGQEHMILNNLVLSTSNFSGREYRIVDSAEDGYFPDDSDRLVNKIYRRDTRSLQIDGGRRLVSSPWKEIPLETEFYRKLTEKFLNVTNNNIKVGSVVN